MGAGKDDKARFVVPPFEEKEAAFEDVFCPLLMPSKVGLTRRGIKNLSPRVLYYTREVFFGIRASDVEYDCKKSSDVL